MAGLMGKGKAQPSFILIIRQALIDPYRLIIYIGSPENIIQFQFFSEICKAQFQSQPPLDDVFDGNWWGSRP